MTIERVRLRSDQPSVTDCSETSQCGPLIFTDAAADWPASQKWNLDFFASRYGGNVGIAPREFGVRPIAGKATLLRTFISHLDGAYDALPGIWVGADEEPPLDDAAGWSFAWEPFKNDPSLFDDVSPFPAAIANMTAALPADVREALERIHRTDFHSIYVSRKDTITPIHRDRHHTFGCLVQFQGRKRIIAFPPDAVSPGRKFNPENPDYHLYPAMRDQIAYTTVLEPPEMLIIPPNWPHYTRSLDHSITLSHNFFNGSNLGAYLRSLLDDIAKWPDKAELSDTLATLLRCES